MKEIQNTNDLLSYLIAESDKTKNWFGFQQQRMAGIDTAYRIAINHADKISPDEAVKYVVDLNNAIYNKLIKG